MSNQTQQQIDALIQFINETEDPESITNTIVASVLAYLSNNCVNLAGLVNALATGLTNETAARQQAVDSISARCVNLEGLINALTTDLTNETAARQQAISNINSLLQGDASDAIESLQEVLAFLAEVTDDKTLSGLLLALRSDIDSNSSGIASLLAWSQSLVVDDLEAGGVEKALSAQQGKMLNDRMSHVLDGIELPQVVSAGKLYYNPGNNRLRYYYRLSHSAQTVYREFEPVVKGLYFDKGTEKFYEFTGSEMVEMIGEMGDGGSTVSVEGDTLVITDNTSPVLHMVPSVVHFSDTLFGQSATAPVSVSGKRLTGAVTIGLTGSGFSANKQTLTPDADGNLTDTIIITFVPTGSGEDVEFTGLLTATHDGVQMASVELTGTGVAEIVPRVEVKMNGDDVSAIALKGVLSSTAEGDYTDEPSKATLHIQGRNISNGVMLELTSGTKFSLSKNSLTAEEALAGADIVVSYNRQDEVTQTDDTAALRISCQDLQGDITIRVSGATGEKNTTNEEVVYSADGITYYNYNGNVGMRATEGTGNLPRTFNGPLVPPAAFYDDYGYKYTPSFVGSKGFYKSSVTSVELGENINAMYSQVYQECTSLTSVKLHEVAPQNSSIFNGCTSLVTFDCVKFSISYNNTFKDCTKLETYIIRRTDAVETFSSGKTDVMPSTEIDGNTVYYYVDSNGVNRQKKLYVPQALTGQYAAHSEWGKFDVQAIEGSEFDTAQSQPVALRSTLRASANTAVKKVRKNGTEKPIGADAQNVSYSGDVAGATNVKDALDALAAGAGSGGSTPDMSQYGYYGQNFPQQMSVVRNVLDNNKISSYPRLRFIHISDSHSADIGNADSLLANTAADFAVHTGDGVGGNYGDGVTGLYAKMLACTKPFFFAIGNHDCLPPDAAEGEVQETITLAQRYTRYIEPIVTKSAWYGSGVTLNHPEGKTYYSVDFAKSSAKYKCIFLDQADGVGDVDLSSGHNNSAVIFGKMTDDQVVWFIGQLQDAADKAKHVMVFLHVRPDSMKVDTLEDWCDHESLQRLTQSGQGLYTMPINIVDAFQSGSSYTYNGEVYEFKANGVFVGWFVGHAHCDCYGWSILKPNQPIFVTTQPHKTASTEYDQNSGGPHINYITVDYNQRKVILYRMGVDRTWENVKRESFIIDY